MAFFKKPDTPVKNPLCVLGDKNVLIFTKAKNLTLYAKKTYRCRLEIPKARLSPKEAEKAYCAGPLGSSQYLGSRRPVSSVSSQKA